MVCQVIVCGVMGKDVTVELCDTEEQMKSMTVKQLKDKMAQTFPFIAGDMAVRLIFEDRDLNDDSKLLSEYGIEHMSVIEIVMRLSGGGSPVPEPGPGGMGDRDGRNISMEKLEDFRCPQEGGGEQEAGQCHLL